MGKPFRHKEQHGSPLKTLLLDLVPANDQGNKTLTHLAELVPMSRWAIQKWLHDQSVPAERVPRLIEISQLGGRKPKTPRDFDQFVYGATTRQDR